MGGAFHLNTSYNKINLKYSPKINSLMKAFKLSAIILLLISCKSEINDTIPLIEMEGNIGNFKPFKLSELNGELEYVVLETNSNILFREIRFIDISSEYIVVGDGERCILFDRRGRYIRNIGSRGKGPGEYTHMSQIKLLDSRIYIPDPTTNKINIYSSSGEFIDDIKTPGGFSNSIYSHNWKLLTDTTFFIQIPNNSGNEEYRIALINDAGEILKGYPNTKFYTPHNPAAYRSYNIQAYYYNRNDRIYFMESRIDTIWQVGEKYLEPAYSINRGKYGFPPEHREWPISVTLEEMGVQPISITNVFESGEFIYFRMLFGKNYPFDFYKKAPLSLFGITHYFIIGLYNKTTGEFFFVAPSNIDHQIEPTGFENDIDGGINFMPMHAVNDTLLVSWFEVYELKMYVATKTFQNSSPKYPEKKKELEELAASLNGNDNPVLMLVKLNP